MATVYFRQPNVKKLFAIALMLLLLVPVVIHLYSASECRDTQAERSATLPPQLQERSKVSLLTIKLCEVGH